jgi:hypothetical protein
VEAHFVGAPMTMVDSINAALREEMRRNGRAQNGCEWAMSTRLSVAIRVVDPVAARKARGRSAC